MLKKSKWQISPGESNWRETRPTTAGARFVWNLEVLGEQICYADQDRARAPRTDQRFEEGWIGLNGMYANELTGLLPP